MGIIPREVFWTDRITEAEPSKLKAELAVRVRLVRQRRVNMTLSEFGREVALVSGRKKPFSNVTVANWESARQEPSFSTLQGIARLANLPLVFFAGVGDLEDWPKIDWVVPIEHTNDGRFRKLGVELETLAPAQRRTAALAMRGLIEGLADAQAESTRTQ